MRRFRELTTETAGFYNTVGFNDDTRAFPSIPARHDVARRVDCGYLAELVVTHRLDEEGGRARGLPSRLREGLQVRRTRKPSTTGLYVRMPDRGYRGVRTDGGQSPRRELHPPRRRMS